MASNGSLHSGHLVVTSAHRVMHVKQKVWCDVAWQPRSVDGSMHDVEADTALHRFDLIVACLPAASVGTGRT